MDKLKKAEAYGNIPSNIGWDPYRAYRFLCKWCGYTGYIFEDQLSKRQRRAFKEDHKGQTWGSCRSCRQPRVSVVERLSRKDAFHKNDIRNRRTTINKDAAVYGMP